MEIDESLERYNNWLTFSNTFFYRQKFRVEFIVLYFLASLSNLGQLGGSLVTGVLSNSIGRRPTIMLLCIPLLCGWVTVGLSGGSIIWICIGRVLQGVGIMSSVTQVYLVEIADAQRRYYDIHQVSS